MVPTMEERMKCKHDECHCSGNDVQQNGYCSDSCRQGEMKDGKCGCGHPACK